MADRSTIVGNPDLTMLLDELAERLATNFKDDIVLKGGFVSLKRFPDNARFTKDIDVDLLKVELYPEMMRVVREWADAAILAGKGTSYSEREPEGDSCGKLVLFKDGKQVCNIDIHLNRDERLAESVILRIGGYDVQVTTLEQVVVDKLSAFAGKRRFRRTKDMYDLWLVWNYGTVDLKTVYKILVETGALVVEEPPPFSDESLKILERGYKKLDIRPIDKNQAEFIREGAKESAESAVEKPAFEDVLASIEMLIERLLHIANND